MRGTGGGQGQCQISNPIRGNLVQDGILPTTRLAAMAPEYAFFMPDTELTSDITMDHDRPWPGDPPPQSAMQSMSTADLLSRQGMGHPSYSSENSPTHMTGGYDEQSQNMPGSSYLLQHDLEEGTSRDSPLSAAAVAQKAKRNRNALSCAECRRLKLKCNRQWPCGVSSASASFQSHTVSPSHAPVGLDLLEMARCDRPGSGRIWGTAILLMCAMRTVSTPG